MGHEGRKRGGGGGNDFRVLPMARGTASTVCAVLLNTSRPHGRGVPPTKVKQVRHTRSFARPVFMTFRSTPCPQGPCASRSVGIRSLQRNLTLRNLVTRLQAEKQKSGPILCGVCEEAPAAFDCEQCGFELCESCRNTQHQVESL